MYIGSVRFFKHVILGLPVALALAIVVIVAVFSRGAGEKDDEIATLKAASLELQAQIDFLRGEQSFTPEEFYGIMQSLGIGAEEFIAVIYTDNEDAFAEILGISASADLVDEPEEAQTTPEETTAVTTTAVITTTTTTTTPEPEEDLGPYAELFPHLYAEEKPETSYRDDSGYIYLTFDDGPSKYTHDVLYILKLHDVKATFFVMPDDTQNSRDYLNQMLAEGHEIGIHTMTHVYSEIYASVEAYLDDFNQAWNMVYEQTGYKPYLYRFPGGSLNDYNAAVRDGVIEEMGRRGFVYFDWNVDSKDALDASWTEMYNSVLEDVSMVNRAVVLFHDRPGGQNTVYVLEDIIKALLGDSRGYVFDKITRDTRPMQF